MTLTDLRKALRAAARPGDAEFLQRFFKTGPGQYAEGDKFLGVRVPEVRKLVKLTDALIMDEVLALVRSEIHEERLLGLQILVRRFDRGDERERKAIFGIYLEAIPHINNWDLVDGSAPNIVGKWMVGHTRETRRLAQMARAEDLWTRRIAMLATFAFIREGQLDQAIAIAELLLHDSHDLIHKAVGWMLREAGARDVETLRAFLKAHAAEMPRTMLRYAIEKLSPAERKRWMAAKALA